MSELTPDLITWILLGTVGVILTASATNVLLRKRKQRSRSDALDPAAATDISRLREALSWLNRLTQSTPVDNTALSTEPRLMLDGSSKSPEGYLRLRRETETEGPPGTRGCGQIAILAVGTYAARQLPGILQQFERAGAAEHVGLIYLLEFDEESRALSMDMVPEAFKSRIVQGKTAHFPIGFSNASVERVYEHDELWRKDVEDQADVWLRRMQAETTPGLLLALVSPGGMAGLGRPALDAFKVRYPHLPVYLITMLDNRQQVRKRFPVMRELYLSPDLVRGAIVTDNRRDSRTSDDGIAYLFAGLIGATWITDRPLTLWNSLGLIFSQDQPLRIGTLSTWAEPLPVGPAPHADLTGDMRLFVKTGHVEEKALRGIRAVVEDSTLQALALEPVRDGSTLICLVTVPVDAADLQPVASTIEKRLRPWLERTHLELSIQFTSTGAAVDPDISEARLSVVLLQPLTGGAEALDGLTLETGAPNPKFQPRTAYTIESRRPVQTPAEHRNGSPHPSENPAS